MIKKLLSLSLLITLGLSGCTAISDDIALHVNKVGRVNNIQVDNLRYARYHDILQVQATLYNSNSNIQQVYYRCVFFNNTKFQTNTNIQWLPLLIYGNQSQVISCQGATSDESDFQLELSTTGKAMKNYSS